MQSQRNEHLKLFPPLVLVHGAWLGGWVWNKVMFAPYAQQAAVSPEWQLYSLAGDHLAMVSTPDALAALLLQAVLE